MVDPQKRLIQMAGESVYIFKNEQRVKIILHATPEAFFQNAPGGEEGIQALFHPYDYTIRVDPDGAETVIWQEEIGEIHLVSGRYGSGVVAHEAAHACLWWARMNRFDLADHDTEESYCWELGKLVAQFWTWHYSMLHYVTGLA